MSKLSFRARALDPSKSLNIHIAEELPDLTEYSAINRAVPQMPSGMEKEEESVSFFFHHHRRQLGRAFSTAAIFIYIRCRIFFVLKNEATPSWQNEKKIRVFFSLVRALFDMYALAILSACIFFPLVWDTTMRTLCVLGELLCWAMLVCVCVCVLCARVRRMYTIEIK